MSIKEAGIKIIFRAVTPTAENTREAIEAGVDVIIATGFDEGGTVPANILPLIVDAADGKVPVVAAGGLVDKRTVRAAFDLGAEGVYAGTAFLATEESPLAEKIKQDMLKYDADDLLMFRAPNSLYRSLPGELPEKLLEMDKQGKSAAEIWAAAGDYNCLLYGMHDGDLSRGIASFGLGISSIHSIDPVSVVVNRLNSGVIA
ncbi:nitronate monooxygenase [Lactobacillus delbrueckii subsp. lactis]|nr:nitronate monooxygenase [Lactobacillus delbrueckii subsp. lactis]